MKASAWAEGWLDIFLPGGCLCCGAWVPGGASAPLVCARCRSRLPVAPWPRCARCHHPRGTGRPEESEPVCRMCRGWPGALSFARHAHVLAPPADTLVHALKYEGWRELADPMAEAMARVTLPSCVRTVSHTVVPVPTTVARVRRRGYNQALLLAEGVARRLGLDLLDGLHRERGSVTQVALHPSERRTNVKGAFAVREEAGPRLRGAYVLLVDDVLTTGATAVAAAMELTRVGVSEVTLLTYARAFPFLRRPER